jgi:hypothetical protein
MEETMNRNQAIKSILFRTGIALVILATMLNGGFAPGNVQAAPHHVAYLYLFNTTLRDAFKTMLTTQGLAVDAYDLTTAMLATTSFSGDDSIIIADDAGATGGIPPGLVTKITASHKPVVGIGEGGSVFFAQTSALFTRGALSTSGSAYNVHAGDSYAPIWQTPNQVSLLFQNMNIYSAAVPVYTYTLIDTVQSETHIGRLVGNPNQYSLVGDGLGTACYSFWGYQGAPSVMTPAGKSLFYNMVQGSPCAEGHYVLNSALASTPPAIDGVLNYGEWTLGANQLEMDHGIVAAMNDNLRLYLLIDVLESRVNNLGTPQNSFMVTFDTNNDAAITANEDMNYGMIKGTQNMRYQHYLGPAKWTSLSTSTKSSLGPGFDCYTPDNTKVLVISPPHFSCDAHQIWEVAIDLHEIKALPGQILHIGLETVSPNPGFTDEVPNTFDVDFHNLIELHLAGTSVPNPTPGASIDFSNPPLELTQVVQDVNNSVRLINSKDTAGRVSVKTLFASTPQPVIYYLYGRKGGADLPGSPLAQLGFAPLAVNRANLKDTANFLLPPSWTGVGDMYFQAAASDYNGHNITSTETLINFVTKAKPVYWFIQENMGTANAPDLLSQATIDSFESYIKATFPAPDVTFVQKPWTVLGALNGMDINTNVATVENYYSSMSAIYWSYIKQSKVPPFALPDLIFGAGNIGGGISDPTWFNNSPGHAAVGGFASSGEGVAAHEFNHDLDRSSSGTWGRHIAACGAAGPDPNWPYGTDPAVHEIGFDTRQPWQNTTTSKTVIPTNWPDLMSYCGSGQLPTKWISLYRYSNWVNNFATSKAIINPSAPEIVPVDSLYVSGSINNNNTASLDPALLSPGMPVAPSSVGNYSLELLNGTTIVASHAFNETFKDVENNPLTRVYFQFVLPNPGSVTGIRLLHGATVLASIDKSAAAPSAAFTFPKGGENFSGVENVTWKVSDADTPRANLRLNLEYSPDNGVNWLLVAANLPGTLNSYALDTRLLPKSISQGKLRLWVTDGLNNITADSGGVFSVPNHAPVPNILAPRDGGYLPSGLQVLLQGQATDVEEASLPDNNFQWTLDGTTVLGVGPSLKVVLPDGRHTLTLTALDTDGAHGSTTITVFVNLRTVYLPVIHR